MHWTERRRARTHVGLALRARGWTLYGFHEDRSEPRTDYFAPASWDGVAEKNGYVVVVDVPAGSSLLKRSGGWRTTRRVPGDDCPYCEGSGKEPGGRTLEGARANPREFNHSRAGGGQVLLPGVVSPVLFDSNGNQKCTGYQGQGHGWKLEEVVVEWPKFGCNPARKLWHVEQTSRILDSGVGLGPCADWDRERATAAVARIVARIEAAIAGNEGQPETTTGSRATGDGVTIRRNLERQGVEVVFPAKPAEEVRAGLKRLGFRWSRRQGLWYARFSPSLWDQVHDLLGTGDGQEPASDPLEEAVEPGGAPDPTPDRTEAALTVPMPSSTPAREGTEAPAWTVSRLAYQESRALCAGGVPILNTKDGREHEAAVRRAVAEGLPVPSHVQAEYGLTEEASAPERLPAAPPEPLQLALFTPS